MTKTLLVAAAALFATAGVAFAQPMEVPTGAQIVTAWDTDHDGSVSPAEWTAAGRPEAAFARVDGNSDGKISAAELDTAIAAMRAQQGAAPPPAPPAPAAPPASGQ